MPGVTGALCDAKVIDHSGIPAHVLERAAARGTAVHLALEYLDRGTLDRDSLDSELEPYVRAYEAFCIDSGFVCGSAERSRYHLQRGYAGTLDRLGMFGTLGAIVDFKSGEVQPGHFAQLCAYAHFFPSPRSRRLIALQLKPDARYRVHEVPPGQFDYYSSLFFCALTCAQFRLSERKVA